MAVSLNFRSAIGGFHREDVVHYIEYMNSRHTSQLSQLESEAQELRSRLEAMPDLTAQTEALTLQLDEAEARFVQAQQEKEQLAIELDETVARLTAQIEALTAQLSDAQAQAEQAKAAQAESAARELAAMELEAYRRAEQAERSAKARAEQIYQQATGTLAQATTQVDSAATRFRQIAEQVGCQMTQLQLAVDASKNALLDAATTMYAIRPESNKE